MKTFKRTVLLVGILIAACAYKVSAQTRSENTASARAIYGGKSGKHHKAKKKKNIFRHGQFHLRTEDKNTRKKIHHAWAS